MLAAGSGIGVGIDPVAAAEAAAASAVESLSGEPGGVAAAVVVATAAWGGDIERVLPACAAVLETDMIAGGSVCGVLHGGHEVAQNPAVGVLALAGVYADVVLLEELTGEEERAGEEIAERLELGPRPEDLILLFPDSQALQSGPLLVGLREALAPGRVFGVGASALHNDRPRVWAGDEVSSRAMAALAVRLPQPAWTGIAQGGCLTSQPLTITRAQGNWILGLDGRPALEVYREVVREPLASDLARASRSIVVALPAEGSGVAEPGCLLIRDVVGFDLERGGFSIPQPVETGAEIALVRLDARIARENLSALLGDVQSKRPAFGLYFGCHRRGESLFGLEGLEAGYLDRIAAPTLGSTGPFQIAPLGPRGRPALLTYAGALALVSAS